MVVLGRGADESMVIEPAAGVAGTILAKLFADGPIQIMLGAAGRRAQTGIVAPGQLAIRRKDCE